VSYYHDDLSDASRSPRSFLPGFLVLILLITGGGFFVKTTLAANISLNSGRTVEFGQAVSQAVACSGGQSLTVTPKSSFVNAANSSGTYNFSSVTVSGIPDTCNGKVFTIKLYDNESAEPIVVTDFSEPGYEEDSAIQVYWGNGYINDMPPSYAMIHFENYQWFLDNRDFDGECIDTVGTCLETSDTEGSNLPSNAFKVILPAPVNATRVYKITVESQDDASTFTSYPDVSNGDTPFTSSFEDFFIDYIRPSWND
jgi:hypothetical protein